MRKTSIALGAVCAVMFAGVAYRQSTASMPMPEHHHHDDAPGPGERLGHVSFPTSCAAASQPKMGRGVALLHSFGYTEAQMQFTPIAKHAGAGSGARSEASRNTGHRRAANRRSKRFAVGRVRRDGRCLELLPEGDISV